MSFLNQKLQYRGRPRAAVLFLLVTLLGGNPGAWGHEPQADTEIGITEAVGRTLPSPLVFRDEAGREIVLGELLDRPTVLTLVYYTCGRFCPQLLGRLSVVLPALELQAGRDFRVLTISFDERDTVTRAAELRRNYLKALGRPFPEEAWKFLTGNKENITALCAAIGFTFRPEMEGFAHPVALMVLAPGGEIAAYLPVSKFAYGVETPLTFSTLDLTRALQEAALGRVVPTTPKKYLYCFPHEPPRQSAFFNLLGLVGMLTLLCLGLFFLFLVVWGKKDRKEKRG